MGSSSTCLLTYLLCGLVDISCGGTNELTPALFVGASFGRTKKLHSFASPVTVPNDLLCELVGYRAAELSVLFLGVRRSVELLFFFAHVS